MRRNNPWPLERDKGLSSPPTRVHPHFFHQVSESRPRPPVLHPGDIPSKISVLVIRHTFNNMHDISMNTDIHEVTDILYILIIYQKTNIYSCYTSPANRRLRNTRLSRPCWTAAAPSSPQSRCAAAYNVDRVFPAPQGIHPQKHRELSGLWSRCFGWMCFFLGSQIFKEKNRTL